MHEFVADTQNREGRDFVVGDIHGTFDILRRAMSKAGFDESKDRLFLLGDYLNRGKYSLDAIDFLNYSFVKAIKGNHEIMFLDLFDGEKINSNLLTQYQSQQNLFTWVKDTSLPQLQKLRNTILQLPTAREVLTTRGLVGFVHADVPRGWTWDEFKDAIKAQNKPLLNYAVWNRSRVENAVSDGVQRVGRVFVGHTVVKSVHKLGNVYYLDTGSTFRELYPEEDLKLTMANIITATQALSTPQNNGSPYQVLGAFEAPPENEFGKYTK